MPYVIALVPSVGVGILFWIVIKNMIEGDRKERIAHSQWEAEQAALVEQKRQAAEKSESEAQKKQDSDS
jgi:hypothetical protein